MSIMDPEGGSCISNPDARLVFAKPMSDNDYRAQMKIIYDKCNEEITRLKFDCVLSKKKYKIGSVLINDRRKMFVVTHFMREHTLSTCDIPDICYKCQKLTALGTLLTRGDLYMYFNNSDKLDVIGSYDYKNNCVIYND